MVAFLAQATVAGRAFLAPAAPPVVVAQPDQNANNAFFLAPSVINGRSFLAPRIALIGPQPVISLTVRFNVLPRDFRTKITHFSN